MIGKKLGLPLLLTLLCVAMITYPSFSPTLSLEVTVATDKSSYVLRETVQVHGNVTYDNEPVEEGMVAIQIENSLSNLVIRTVPTGTDISGGGGIKILSVSPCDSTGNPKDEFERGKWAYFKATVRNNDIVEQTVLITINIYDSTLTPLGIGATQMTIDPDQTITFIPGIWIDKWASPGNAPIYANVLTDWPENMGYPYSPEKTANFTIIESEFEEPPNNQIPEQPVQNGAYEIQFQLSPEPLPGTYTVRVCAWYKGYKSLATTTFQVEDIPAPPRASFVAKPPTASPNYTITFDASSSSAEGYGDTITSYAWDFGDTQGATGKIVQHSYPHIGNYTVILNVTDSEGFWNTTSKIIRIAITRDIALTHIQCLDEVYSDWLVTITVIVKNQGTMPETFNVTAYNNTSVIEVRTITELGALEQSTVTFTWDTTGITPPTNRTIWAEATAVPNETDTTNNVLIYGITLVKMLGDVAYNRQIDIYDVVRICASYGSESSDPEWDPQADLIPNGEIDIYDVVVVCSKYGTTY